MGVGDFVAHYFGEDEVGVKGLLLGLGYFLHYFKIRSGVRRHLSAAREFPDPAEVFFRNDLGVAGRLRVDVQERQKVFVLVDFLRGHFARDYFAEDAGFHA